MATDICVDHPRCLCMLPFAKSVNNTNKAICKMIIAGFTGQLKGWWDNYMTLDAKAAVINAKDDLYNQIFLIKTNAQSVKYMFDKDFKHDASKLMFARWQAQLSPFDFEILYKKGSEDSLPDFLFREYIQNEMENPWVTKGRGKGNIHRGRGRSSLSSSRSSYGSSSSNTPIIQKGGMTQEKVFSSIHLEDISESDPLYAQLQEFITQKQSDTFASIAKEDVDDIKTYEKVEKREMIFLLENSDIQRREEPWKIFQRYLVNGLYFPGYNTSENVYNFSKMIIKHVIHIEDWGISSMTERQFSLNKAIINFTYWDYIQAFSKVLCYNNERHKHTWFIKVSEVDFTEEQIPCLYMTYYNNFWDKLMKKDPQTKFIYGQELLDLITKTIKDYKSIPNKRIMTDDSTSVKHMARKISNHDEEEKDEMIMKYLEEVKKKILLNLTHYTKSYSSMRSETSEDIHEAQPYEEERPVDTLKKADGFLAKMKDKI
ncbi:hypothetical protein H5410_005479 [Solanum commersonii]|uniref:DUF7746 domain-containing protein n=1 Tax=Solanum commersonii TaxID=4109 RepID=A0A9J6A6Q5_SOLCO|nr:hypothetical protein H5410_005479 [Solanum commersonii]